MLQLFGSLFIFFPSSFSFSGCSRSNRCLVNPISPFQTIFGHRLQAISRVRNIKCPNRSIRYRWSGLYGALRSFTQEHWSAVGVQRSVSKMSSVLLVSSTDSNSCLIFAIGSLSTQVSDYYLGRLFQQMSDNISIVSICLPMIVKFMGKKEQNNNIQDPRASSTGHLRNVQSLSTWEAIAKTKTLNWAPSKTSWEAEPAGFTMAFFTNIGFWLPMRRIENLFMYITLNIYCSLSSACWVFLKFSFIIFDVGFYVTSTTSLIWY